MFIIVTYLYCYATLFTPYKTKNGYLQVQEEFLVTMKCVNGIMFIYCDF